MKIHVMKVKSGKAWNYSDYNGSFADQVRMELVRNKGTTCAKVRVEIRDHHTKMGVNYNHDREVVLKALSVDDALDKLHNWIRSNLKQGQLHKGLACHQYLSAHA